MGLISRKRAIVVYNNIKLNPACLASEPSKYSNEIFHVHVRILYLSIAKNKHADQSARMRMLVCAFVMDIQQNQAFLWRCQ